MQEFCRGDHQQVCKKIFNMCKVKGGEFITEVELNYLVRFI